MPPALKKKPSSKLLSKAGSIGGKLVRGASNYLWKKTDNSSKPQSPKQKAVPTQLFDANAGASPPIDWGASATLPTNVDDVDANGQVIEAKAAIVAIPPPLRQRITYTPDLSAETRSFLQRSPMGSMIKVFAIYKKAYWRRKNLNGFGVGNLKTLELTADSSLPSGTPGILASFVTASAAVAFKQMTLKQQRRAVLDDLIAYWGPEAGEPEELIIQNWNEESWSTGAFTSFVTPGAWTTYGRGWQQSHGRVHWAGTEASTRWPGYFEGAIEAGIQASRRAVAQL